MSAPPRFLSPFVRTRTRLAVTLGLVLIALTAALLPWWHQSGDPPPAQAGKAAEARKAATGPRNEAAAQAEARRTRKPVLVDTATTATSQTWAQPDGKLRTQITTLPQRAKTATGKWAPIDNRLRRVKNAARSLSIQPVNAAQPMRFSAGTKAAHADRSFARVPLAEASQVPQESVLAEVDIDGHTITYTWPGPLPEPVLDGPRALYSEVLPGVDLLLLARQEGGFAQLLIVKNAQAAKSEALATVAYGLRSPTAVFHHDTDSGSVLVQDKSGNELGSIPTPFAWDSSGRDPEGDLSEDSVRTSVATPADVLKLSGLSGIEPGAHSAPIPMHLNGDATSTARLDLNPAQTGLFTDPDVTYPLFVDPTLNSGWLAWTVAYKPYPNTSFWNGTNFSSGTSDARVGHESDTGGTARSFWRMNYSSALRGAIVNSATFKVLNNHSWSCTTREFQIWLTGAISSGTTWNAQPSWSTLLQKKSFAHGWSSTSCPDSYEAFDVRTAAQKAADGGWSNITLGMRATSETDTETWRKFQATTATLEVVYNRPPATPSYVSSTPGSTCNQSTGGATVGLTNVILSAKSSDPDNNLKGLRFRFWKSGTATPAGTLVTSLSSGKATLTIASTSLVDKGIYYWDVRAEDSGGLNSAYYPVSGNRCTLTVDGSGPPPPSVDSAEFPEATPDGLTWSSVKFGGTGDVTFSSEGAAKFTYTVEGVGGWSTAIASNGTAKVAALKPPHSGPNWLLVYAFDASGNASKRTDYSFYVPPRDKADVPFDTGGDGIGDLLTVDGDGNLRNCTGGPDGDLFRCLPASYDENKKLDPQGHWYDPATGKTALITHWQDTYPSDGSTDLFAVTPDGRFYLYPGDGYGSFDVDQRLKIRLPSNAPSPSTWKQIRATGDITGDKLPDLMLRSGDEWWTLSGYTGATFQTATRMEAGTWARQEIVNVTDINGDNTPDVLWRNLDSGTMSLRQGKPGTVTGSVDLESLKQAANSLTGKDEPYGTGWAESTVSAAIGIPDVNNDGIPDIWARLTSDGQMRIYQPSRTAANQPIRVVEPGSWNSIKAFG